MLSPRRGVTLADWSPWLTRPIDLDLGCSGSTSPSPDQKDVTLSRPGLLAAATS